MIASSSRFVRAAELVLAAIFIGGGLAKVAGVPVMVALFDEIGFGQWLRYVTGVVEICGGTLLVLPMYSIVGALALAAMMVVATGVNVAILHRSPLLPAATLVALLAVSWMRRTRVRAMLGVRGSRSA